ncbi:16S rRNA (cytosine(1402)-N(4))-methyltransferase RsmH [Candidatus Saccharibacteria bacterium]|nr:16S rRNA (cytosine(1402)-N(4))-methyltransferase RsmH [Candidatus Saccharibacteria bacterium]
MEGLAGVSRFLSVLHIPVLLSEVIANLDPHPGEKYLDLTAGYGGHASKILDVTQSYKDSVLIDRDEFATDYLKQNFPSEITIMNQDFYSAVLQLFECGKTFDLILADFGVSSPQLDLEERGFSFRFDGPLDMRMDRRQILTAEDVVNKYGERELTNIFVKYGEESPGRAAMLARIIVTHRPLRTTKELADLIKTRWHGYSKTHPATKIFQAIRIVVNDELGEIEKTLPLLPKLLNRDGRLGIITFHSLEDRLVKDFYKESSNLGEESELEILTKKPIVAESNELVINPRSRSAKLRVARKRN